jgi:hypothetical protein
MLGLICQSTLCAGVNLRPCRKPTTAELGVVMRAPNAFVGARAEIGDMLKSETYANSSSHWTFSILFLQQ